MGYKLSEWSGGKLGLRKVAGASARLEEVKFWLECLSKVNINEPDNNK